MQTKWTGGRDNAVHKKNNLKQRFRGEISYHAKYAKSGETYEDILIRCVQKRTESEGPVEIKY